MEVWKDIKWYEWLYQVSNLWNVKSFAKSKEWRLLKWRPNDDWYLRVMLCNKTIENNFFIHRLVWQAFIENPNNKEQINHINWIKFDNRLENLEWVNNSENQIHSYNILWKKRMFWKDNHKSRWIIQIWLNWIIKKWESVWMVQRELNIQHQNIIKVCQWKRKTAWWYKWQYV